MNGACAECNVRRVPSDSSGRWWQREDERREEAGQSDPHARRVEAEPGWGQLVALLEVAIAPAPLTSDESIA
jgi:hypothetical protein